MSNKLPLNLSLEELGLTAESLADRVVEAVTRQLTTSIDHDEDGIECESRSPFIRAMQEQIRKAVDAKVQEIAERDLLPKIGQHIESMTLQTTNQWGQKTGKPMTFIEYLTAKAEAYLTEQVDYEGKGKGQRDGYSWKGTQTRLTHIIHGHLHYSIERAMKEAVDGANKVIVGGLEAAVKVKLGEIASALKVEVNTK